MADEPVAADEVDEADMMSEVREEDGGVERGHDNAAQPAQKRARADVNEEKEIKALFDDELRRWPRQSVVVFDGTEESLSQFLTSLELMFKLRRVDERVQHLLAGCFLTGIAAEWYLTACDSISSFGDFKSALFAQFSTSNKPLRVVATLMDLKQRGTVATFVQEFQRCMLDLERFKVPVSDRLLQLMFQARCAPVVANMLSGAKCGSIREVFDRSLALRSDDQRFEKFEQRGPGGVPRGHSGHQHPRVDGRASSSVGQSQAGPAGQHARGLGKERAAPNGKPNGNSQVTCFNCNEVGHYARDCRAPPQLANLPWSSKPKPQGPAAVFNRKPRGPNA